jgi:UDPglucose 6-dehydrogenase
MADFGNMVTCVDSDLEKIESLRRSEIPFYEPGLEQIVERNVREGHLSFTTDLAGAVRKSSVIFIAVGTPRGTDGDADLSAVKTVARDIARTMTSYRLIVQKSTVPVGTGRLVHEIIKKNRTKDVPFDVASNPEFLREGSALETFMRADRVVIGTWSKKAERILSEIYAPLYLLETPMVKTTVETAELIKYASNAFLATKISFINEMANLCELVGADVKVVAKAMGLDKRIGPKFLHAGPGYGGSCFPKDTIALAQFSKKLGEEMRIVQAAVDVNDRQLERVLAKIVRCLGPNTKGKTVGLLGLSFKPNTDDVRDSPAVEIVNRLVAKGVHVKAFDPVAMAAARKVTPSSVEFVENAYQVAEGADALVIATEWNEFRRLDAKRLLESLREPVLVDLRNIYEPEVMRRLGFTYIGVGRGETNHDFGR